MPHDLDRLRDATVSSVRARLVRLAHRHSRRAAEAEDLAHDIIVTALRRGIALDDEIFVKSLGGAARRHAAFVARGAGRRRQREARVAAAVDDVTAFELVDVDGTGTPVTTLTPTLRTTVLLLLGGLTKAEVCAVLGINDAALRKRLQALRAMAPLSAPRLPASSTTVIRRLRTTQIALLQRLTTTTTSTTTTRASDRAVAVADPDGHGLIFVDLTDPRGSATAFRPAPLLVPTKGSAC